MKVRGHGSPIHVSVQKHVDAILFDYILEGHFIYFTICVCTVGLIKLDKIKS